MLIRYRSNQCTQSMNKFCRQCALYREIPYPLCMMILLNSNERPFLKFISVANQEPVNAELQQCKKKKHESLRRCSLNCDSLPTYAIDHTNPVCPIGLCIQMLCRVHLSSAHERWKRKTRQRFFVWSGKKNCPFDVSVLVQYKTFFLLTLVGEELRKRTKMTSPAVSRAGVYKPERFGPSSQVLFFLSTSDYIFWKD